MIKFKTKKEALRELREQFDIPNGVPDKNLMDLLEEEEKRDQNPLKTPNRGTK